jgi:hypothetical protein
VTDRTDPWRWYCRLCSTSGEFPDRGERDEAAAAHLRDTRCGRFPVHMRAAAGRLVHVWSYPYSAAADLN